MSNHKRLKFLQRPRAAAAIGVLALPALGGVAYAAANSVSHNPKPQIVIPASTSRFQESPATHEAGDDRAGQTAPRAADDNPATHDVRDDRAGRPPTVTAPPRASDDNPATHDVGDDRAGRPPAVTAPPRASDDNPATHDIGDDHGVDNPATHEVGDDHGVDNPATHDVGDDHGGLAPTALTTAGSGGDDRGGSGSGSGSSNRGGHDDSQPHR